MRNTQTFQRLWNTYYVRKNKRPRGNVLPKIMQREWEGADLREARRLKPARQGKKWTKDDCITLVSNFHCGESLLAVSELLQRTPTAVERQLRNMSILLRATPGFYSIYNDRPFGSRLREFVLTGNEVVDLTPYLSSDFIQLSECTWCFSANWRGERLKSVPR